MASLMKHTDDCNEGQHSEMHIYTIQFTTTKTNNTYKTYGPTVEFGYKVTNGTEYFVSL